MEMQDMVWLDIQTKKQYRFNGNMSKSTWRNSAYSDSNISKLVSNSTQQDCRKSILTWTPGTHFLWAKQFAVQRKLEPVCESNTSGAGTTIAFININILK